jgi:hypothetical protein
MAHTSIIPNILAQNASVTEIIGALLQALSTPVGLIGAALMAVLLAFVFLHRNGIYVGGTIVILMMSMMAQENKYFDNTLFTPLQQLREVSRPITVLLLAAMAGNLMLAPAATRVHTLTFYMVSFFLFQTYYLLRLGMRGEVARAGLGWITDLLILIAFAAGHGKRLERDSDFEKFVNMFGIASIGFIVLNMMQLSLGYGQSIAGGRFAGISGNPQLAGYVSATFIIFGTHIFMRSKLGSPSRWIFGVVIGVLAILILWAGSRMSALSAAAGLVMYFRFRLGSATLLAAVGGISLAIVASIFGESLLGIDRFIYGDNTRRGIWLALLDEFYSAPVFGAIGMRGEGTISSNESSYLTTLALMGISGAIPLALFVAAMFGLAGKLLFVRRRGNVQPLHADLVLSLIAIIFVGSVFEGFFLGIISLPVILIYTAGALGAYLVERDRYPLPEDDRDGGEWDSDGQELDAHGEDGDGYDDAAGDSDRDVSAHEAAGHARRE